MCACERERGVGYYTNVHMHASMLMCDVCVCGIIRSRTSCGAFVVCQVFTADWGRRRL